MLRQLASKEVVEYARSVLETTSLGQRGVFDGDEMQQLFGLQAQTIIRDKLGLPREEPVSGWDGGVDLEYNGIRWDVKCVLRDYKPKTAWKCNIPESQLASHYGAEGYIFVSYNRKKGDFWICGWITKEQLLEKADKHEIGDVLKRDDGTDLVVEDMPLCDITIRRLNRIYTLEDLRGIGYED